MFLPVAVMFVTRMKHAVREKLEKNTAQQCENSVGNRVLQRVKWCVANWTLMNFQKSTVALTITRGTGCNVTRNEQSVKNTKKMFIAKTRTKYTEKVVKRKYRVIFACCDAWTLMNFQKSAINMHRVLYWFLTWTNIEEFLKNQQCNSEWFYR